MASAAFTRVVDENCIRIALRNHSRMISRAIIDWLQTWYTTHTIDRTAYVAVDVPSFMLARENGHIEPAFLSLAFVPAQFKVYPDGYSPVQPSMSTITCDVSIRIIPHSSLVKAMDTATVINMAFQLHFSADMGKISIITAEEIQAALMNINPDADIFSDELQDAAFKSIMEWINSKLIHPDDSGIAPANDDETIYTTGAVDQTLDDAGSTQRDTDASNDLEWLKSLK